MFTHIGVGCLLIVLIGIRFVNRKGLITELQNNEGLEFSLEDTVWDRLTLEARDLNILIEAQKPSKLPHHFINICYTLHKMTWGPNAMSRRNFPARINKWGYEIAINKMPIYSGKAMIGKYI